MDAKVPMSEAAGRSAGADAAAAETAARRRLRLSLSVKLLVATVIFVLVATVLVSMPQLSEFRLNWMRNRMSSAHLVAVSLQEMQDVPRSVQDELLQTIGADTIAVRDGSVRRLVAVRAMPKEVVEHFDLAEIDGPAALADALALVLRTEHRAVRILSEPMPDKTVVELVIDEQILRDAMLRYIRRTAATSLLISVITGALVFFSLRRVFVRPLAAMTAAMARFRADPEDPAAVVRVSGRADELGEAERHLAAMQVELADMLKQRSRLADLGIAVSKINHDLRNILGSAQLFTDRLATIPDTVAQRFGPKLMTTLDRAISYSQAVLDYSKVREAPPERRLVVLAKLVRDVADLMGLTGHAAISFQLEVADDLEVDADPDQLFRVLMNLMRNAVLALDGPGDPALVRRITVSGEREGAVARFRIADTGPGVSARARGKLFRAFEGGTRPGGTGLGLAICAELVRAHGGTIRLVDSAAGAVFEVEIPDAAAARGAEA